MRPCRPRAKRPKDSWDPGAEQGGSLWGLEICWEVFSPPGPCINAQGSAVLGLQTGQASAVGLPAASLTFFTSSADLTPGACPILPWQASCMLTAQLSPLYK